MAEFRELGYNGTDSNKIARRAGFAPQTFYRWFADKTEIFIACYRAWEDEEKSVLDGLIEQNAPASKLVDAIIQHHRKHLLFRRSLRLLAVEDPAVRKARAESRRRQAQRIREWRQLPEQSTDRILIALLQIERLADACAEEEGSDLDLPDKQIRQTIAELLSALN